MPTITFDVPESLAQQIAAIPEGERNELAVEALEAVFNHVNSADAFDLTETDHESIRRGLADIDAGQVVDSDTFFNTLYEAVGLPAPAPFMEAVKEARQKIQAKQPISTAIK